MAAEKRHESGGSEEEGEGHGVMHTGRQGDAPEARSAMVAAAGVEGEGGDSDSMTLQERRRKHQLEHGDGTDEGATTAMERVTRCLRRPQLLGGNPTRRRRERRRQLRASGEEDGVTISMRVARLKRAGQGVFAIGTTAQPVSTRTRAQSRAQGGMKRHGG